MTPREFTLSLSTPWSACQHKFKTYGPLVFMVGPNGSGKSRFAISLKESLNSCYYLSTDRLLGTGKDWTLGVTSDAFAQGYKASDASGLQEVASRTGVPIDLFARLNQEPQLRFRIEATLSSLFNRTIQLEWDAGFLIPKAASRLSGSSYRFDRDECHGLRELVILLAAIHDERYQYLIIDEPELNLHPQFQSFFMSELRVALSKPAANGNPRTVFLITHSPFILDFRGGQDMASVITFFADQRLPTSSFTDDPSELSALSALAPRLNAHHKQLFFSDSPIFVEGVLDSLLINAIQERRGVNIVASGSCLLDVGGCEEVNKYIPLCSRLGKTAYFVYDLDSLWTGTLRRCIQSDGTVTDFLAAMGLGSDFAKYTGQLDAELYKLIPFIEASCSVNDAVVELKTLIAEYKKNPDQKSLQKLRYYVMMGLIHFQSAFESDIGKKTISDVRGRLTKILQALEANRILVLPNGALENNLPSYRGSTYQIDHNAKTTCSEAEILLLSDGSIDATSLASRYGALDNLLLKLPASKSVDLEAIEKAYVSQYIFAVQSKVAGGDRLDASQFNALLDRDARSFNKVLRMKTITYKGDEKFAATVEFVDNSRSELVFNNTTNAGMMSFDIPRRV